MRRLNRSPSYITISEAGMAEMRTDKLFFLDGAPFLNKGQQKKLDEMAEDTIRLIKMIKLRDHKKIIEENGVCRCTFPIY